MNTTIKHCGAIIRSLLKSQASLAAVVLTWSIGAQAAVATGGEFAQDALLNPSQAVLRAEQRGRVTIYDGVENGLVEQALDRQFDRIDHMMFVRIEYVQEDGSLEYDDDCD